MAVAEGTHDLISLISNDEGDIFVGNNNGHQISILELEGKMVAFCFFYRLDRSCLEFLRVLSETYNKLKERGESFEVVLLPWERNEQDGQQLEHIFPSIPWFHIPYNAKTFNKLHSYFNAHGFPALAVIGPNGKTLSSDADGIIEALGAEAYPFSPEKFAEFEKNEKKILESSSLESFLITGEQDFVIGKDGIKVLVSELIGNTILLYFSKKNCPPCKSFTPKLIEAYNEIKAKHVDFEVIFVSCDYDQHQFEEYYSGMPWLAIPFGDKRENFLNRIFKVSSIPCLIAIGPQGQILTREGELLLTFLGSNAYPFDNERLKEAEARLEESVKGFPKRLSHPIHAEHELVLVRLQGFSCRICEEDGGGWAYCCDDCYIDLYPECALGEQKGVVKGGDKSEEGKDNYEHDEEESASKTGWICNGEACYRV